MGVIKNLQNNRMQIRRWVRDEYKSSDTRKYAHRIELIRERLFVGQDGTVRVLDLGALRQVDWQKCPCNLDCNDGEYGIVKLKRIKENVLETRYQGRVTLWQASSMRCFVPSFPELQWHQWYVTRRFCVRTKIYGICI